MTRERRRRGDDSPRRRRAASWLLLLLLVIGAPMTGCGEDEGGGEEGVTSRREARAVPEGASITRAREVGPLELKVTLTPAEPRFGDLLSLILEVEAPDGIDVLMPPPGEALGQFAIRAFKDQAKARTGGGQVLTQSYRLEAPSSGPQTIPELLIEFQDHRENSPGDEIQEALTEELPFTIASVLPEGELLPSLRPPRGPLAPRVTEGRSDEAGASGALLWWVVGGSVALVALLLALYILLRRQSQRSAYEIACEGLEGLEREGLPDAEAADGWYVRLSDVVRRYLEGRFALRAPELTTEEFLLAASDSPELEDVHRRLLRELLSRCDRVKFAAYVPSPQESREALEDARRFVEETRLAEQTAGPAPRPQTA